MTLGLHAVNYANKCLDVLNNSAFAAITAVWVQLHIGDPGSAGTANPVVGGTVGTSRKQSVRASASGGSSAQTGTNPSWPSWDSGTETLSHISLWTDVSAGVFLLSADLSPDRTVNDGDTFTLTTLTIAFTPIAA